MRKLTILCDLDAIAVALLQRWLAWYNATYNDNLTPDDVTHWDMHRIVKPACGHRIYDFIDSGEIYRDLEPLPGAVQGILDLERDGHNVVMLSAGSKNLATAGHKLEWCKKNLGFSRKKVIIAHQKELVKGHIFIDDAPKNISAYHEAWPETPILTIAYHYNAEVGHIAHRFPDHNNTAMAWYHMVEWIRGYARV